MTCKDCDYATQKTTFLRCRNHGLDTTENAVICNEFRHRTQTNADRIRSMTDEEMADFLEEHCYQYGWLDWLKQEAGE